MLDSQSRRRSGRRSTSARRRGGRRCAQISRPTLRVPRTRRLRRTQRARVDCVLERPPCRRHAANRRRLSRLRSSGACSKRSFHSTRRHEVKLPLAGVGGPSILHAVHLGRDTNASLRAAHKKNTAEYCVPGLADRQRCVWPEMLQNGTETAHSDHLVGLGPKESQMIPKLII